MPYQNTPTSDTHRYKVIFVFRKDCSSDAPVFLFCIFVQNYFLNMARDKNNGFNPRVIICEEHGEKGLKVAQKIEMVFMMAKAIDAADERRRCSGSEKND